MRPKIALSAAVLMVASATVAMSAPAQAAATTVTIHVIPGKVAKNDLGDETSNVTVSPTVTKTGSVQITHKSVVLIDDAEHTPSATLSLGVGGYKIRTDVTYKTYKIVKKKRVYNAAKTKSLTQNLRVYRPCADETDFNKVKTGDSLAAVNTKLHQAGNGTNGGATFVNYAYLVCDLDVAGETPGSLGVRFSRKIVKHHVVLAVTKKTFPVS
jgi:hypothetical protein